MSDQPSDALIRILQSQPTQNTLLLADENTLNSIALLQNRESLRVISNRFDVAAQLNKNSLPCEFNDFDLNGIADLSLDAIFYRISKEKPVVNHIINQARLKLKSGGSLIFCGYKSDGTKSYYDKARKVFDGGASLKKDGDNYTAYLTASSRTASCEPLDEKDYRTLRPSLDINGQSAHSKPGLFGWDKIDKGSEYLIEQLKTEKDSISAKSLLDLGCGYGYLTLASTDLDIEYRCATDNSAAALMACRKNFDLHGLAGDVIGADCADSISRQFDLILCNPPFHQGFSTDGDLTDKFLAAIYRLLSTKGCAFLVANLFVAIEKKAPSHGLQAQQLARNGSFKVFKLIRAPQ